MLIIQEHHSSSMSRLVLGLVGVSLKFKFFIIFPPPSLVFPITNSFIFIWSRVLIIYRQLSSVRLNLGKKPTWYLRLALPVLLFDCRRNTTTTLCCVGVLCGIPLAFFICQLNHKLTIIIVKFISCCCCWVSSTQLSGSVCWRDANERAIQIFACKPFRLPAIERSTFARSNQVNSARRRFSTYYNLEN